MENLSYPLPRPAALEPPAEWAELRQRCPVAHVTMPSGDQATLLTRYADVRQLLSDNRFSRLLNAPDAARLSDTDSGGVFNSEMASVLPQTGPGHERWRRMISKWFTAKRMTALRPGIEAMAEQLIDEMLAKGHPADLKAGLAFPLPVWVICDLLGVPETDRDRFSHWSDSLLNLTRYTQQEMETAQREFSAYMAGHIAARRRDPGDDLLSELVRATDAEGRGLSDAELVATGQGLLIAGHETTANQINMFLLTLHEYPEQLGRLRAHPEVIPQAVEELMRFAQLGAVGAGLPRVTTEEVELGGVLLPAGAAVIPVMTAANRDPAAVTDPDRLDVTRPQTAHLGFGAGVHHCLGAQLARMELQEALRGLLGRLPRMELVTPVDELVFKDGMVVRSLHALPVRW